MTETRFDPSSHRDVEQGNVRGEVAGYRLVGALGSGSSASVFRGRRVANDAPDVAVKLLRQAQGVGIDQRAQFEHEAELLAHLSHPGIVKLLAHGTHGNQPYLITELADGRSLAHILAEDGALEPVAVAELLRQLALALAHAHSHRILHRDIKPSNIVVAQEPGRPVAKLLDFGFGRQQGNDATNAAAPTVGTFLYMSPEQLGILALAPDERSDLYALGFVAIELLAGRHPFSGLNLRDLIHAHAAVTPQIPARTPSALAQIVALLVRKDPADRYRTAEGLAADVETFIARYQAGEHAPFPTRTQDRYSELVAPRFFGRNGERAILSAAYAAAGRGLRIVAVAGVSGMGKTRLIGEAARGWTRGPVLWGRGRAFGQTAGYGLMAEALRALANQPVTAAMQTSMREAVGSMGGEVLALVPELGPLLGDAVAIAPLEPEHQQQRLFTLLAGLLSTLGTLDAPLVLVLDDLQWADDGSLQFVLHLARLLPPRSLLLILAWRAEEVNPGGRVQQWLDQVRAAREVPLIALEPLTLADVRTVVASMLGGEVAGVAEAVAAQAQGHPLHAIELTYALAERGTLQRGPTGWTLDPEHAARLARDTDDLLHTILRRLDRLGHADREILAIAAVAGRGFGAEIVRRGLQADTLSEPEPAARRTVGALAAAEQAQLIIAGSEPGSYSFVHDKIRESLYEALPAERRARLHGLIGDALSAHDVGSGSTVYLLAYHYGNADDARKAVDAAMRAGTQASQHYAHLEALDFYGRAAGLAEKLLPADRAALAPRLKEAVADSQVATGQFDAALAAYDALLPLDRPIEEKAELHRKLGALLFVRGDVSRAAALLEEALAMLGEPAPVSRPAVLWQLAREAVIQVSHTLFPPRGPANHDPRWATLGGIYFVIENVYAFADFVRAMSIHLRNMNLMERARAVDVLGQAYAMHGPACMVLGMTPRGIRYMERSLALGQARGDRWRTAQTRGMMVLALLAAARWSDALAHVRVAVTELEQHGDPYMLSLSVVFLGLGLAYAGQWDEAEQVCARGHQIAAESRHWIARGYAFVAAAELAARLDLPTMLSSANDVIASRNEGGELGLCAVLRAKGRTLMLLGRLEEAQAVLQQGAGLIYERRFRLLTVLEMLFDHVDVLLMLADRSTSPDRRAQLLRRARSALFKARLFAAGYHTLRPVALRLRARSDWLRGKRSRAERGWGDAAALASRLGLAYQHALCLADWGAALRESNAQESTNLLSSAGASFEALGARHEFTRWKLEQPATRPSPQFSAPTAPATALVGPPSTSDSNARHMRETERMQALLAIAQQLSATREVDTLLQAIVDSAAQLMGAERGMLYLWTADRSAYECHTRFGDALALAAPVSSSVLDAVLQGGTGAVVADAQADPGLDTAPSVMSSGVRSILCAPLVHQGQVLGALYLDNRLMRGLFAAKDLDLLQGLAAHAAIALDNAQLYLQLDRHRTNLEETVRDRTAEAEEARRIAESATRAKGDFLANMSHEIRTPMNAILGMSHLALQSGLNQRQHNFVSKVERSAQSLLGLINDILDFSKIEAGKLDMERIEFALGDVLDGATELLGLRAGEKGLALSCSVAPGVPSSLVGDPLRLRQVLLNLGANAIKFTQLGEVTISVEMTACTSASVTLLFEVRDTGVGMSEAQRLGLFQPFVQADNSITRRYGGTGLGLAISRQLVELMNGTIGVDSELGQGSCFRFTAGFDLPSVHSTPLTSQAALEGLRLLIVNDDATMQLHLTRMAGSLGMRAEVARDGWDALRAVTLPGPANGADAARFDLVLIDHGIPGMDGIECAAQLHRGPHADRAIVVMSSPEAREALELAMSERGLAAAWLAKPTTAATLADACRHALARCSPSEALRARPRGAGAGAPRPRRGARALLVDDNEINLELAQELLTDAGFIVTLAENGREAIELLNRHDFDVVLMDCQMPVMDGYEATREIRRDDRWKSLPVIAMTANAMAGDREKALDAGMNDHIAKPIVLKEMFDTINRWLNKDEREGHKSEGEV